jgi:hypothetical protein
VQAAAAEKSIQRNRAHEQDPSCAVFWTSRGYATPPWRWLSFSRRSDGTQLPLCLASNWPWFLKILHDFDMPLVYKEPDCLDYDVRYYYPLQLAALTQELSQFFRQRNKTICIKQARQATPKTTWTVPAARQARQASSGEHLCVPFSLLCRSGPLHLGGGQAARLPAGARGHA